MPLDILIYCNLIGYYVEISETLELFSMTNVPRFFSGVVSRGCALTTISTSAFAVALNWAKLVGL